MKTDSSVYDQTATVRDTPTTATAAAKFGSTGLSTDPGDLTYSSTSRFQLTGNPFTVDCWANHQTSGVRHTIACFDSGDAWSTASGIQWILHRWDTDQLFFQFWNGTSISVLTSAAILNSTYQHICVTSDGVDVWLFVDGILEDTTTNDMSAVGGSLGLGIGDRFTNPVYNWDGYLDEIRIINGRCAINDPNDPLYISSGNPADGFAPPSSAYPDP